MAAELGTKFQHYHQTGDETCWLSCVRMIHNYLVAIKHAPSMFNKKFNSDEELLRTLQRCSPKIKTATRGHCTGKINLKMIPQYSAREALIALGYPDKGTLDDHAIPTIEEIEDAIHSRCPLLSTIGATIPQGTGKEGKRYLATKEEYEGGHYVIIIGIYDDSDKKKRLKIADPAYATVTDVAYDPVFYEAYGSKSFWINTEYADPLYKSAVVGSSDSSSEEYSSSSGEDSSSSYEEDSSDSDSGNDSDSDYEASPPRKKARRK
jgi:hypothetical protein